LIVIKIGGSCLRKKEDIKKTKEIVEKFIEDKVKPILVVSALSGITDLLLTQAQKALNGRFNLKKIKSVHYEFLESLSPSMRKKTELRLITLLEELNIALAKIVEERTLSHQTRDYIISYGEKLASIIVAACITDAGYIAKTLWGSEAGLITNSNFGNGSLLKESSRRIQNILGNPFSDLILLDEYGYWESPVLPLQTYSDKLIR